MVMFNLTLRDLQERFLNARTLKIAGTVTTVTILLVFLVNILNPKTVLSELNLAIPTFPLGSEIDLRNLEIPADLPSSANVYSIEAEEEINPAKAKEISLNFGITTNPKIFTDINGDTIYLSSQKGRNLTIRSNPWNLRHTITDFVLREVLPGNYLPNPEQAIGMASQQLTKLKLSTTGLINPQVRYLNIETENTVEVDKDSADYVEVSYRSGLEGVEIFNLFEAGNQTFLLINRREEFVTLAYFFPRVYLTINQVRIADIRDVQSVLSEVGQVIWVESDREDSPVIDITKVDRFQPTSVKLVLVETRGELLEPVYLFEGRGEVAGVPVNARVLTPARLQQE